MFLLYWRLEGSSSLSCPVGSQESLVPWPMESLLISTYSSNYGRASPLPLAEWSSVLLQSLNCLIASHWAVVLESDWLSRRTWTGASSRLQINMLSPEKWRLCPLTFCTPLQTGRPVFFFFYPSIYESMIMKIVHICVQYVLIVCLNVLSTLFSYFSLT